jgi:hypothetical protein
VLAAAGDAGRVPLASGPVSESTSPA